MRILFRTIFSLNSRIKLFNFKNYSSANHQMSRAMSANLEITSLAEKMPQIYSKFTEIKQTPEIKLLDDIFTEAGHEIRMAGGAVRDLLTGVIPSDIDFATTATPTQMERILGSHPNEIRMITTKSGIMHGTITARINDRVQYEITTLRIDKKTDGRHAEVEFITDWMLDASRRDLTINAMFLDLKGNLIDYFGGANDLANRSIKFVGDPRERLIEDYLRIFRYFRFYVRYGSHVHHDEETIQAIIDSRHGLQGISGERIWSEMKKILTLPRCNTVIHTMFHKCLIGSFMGFQTEPIDLTEFDYAHKNLNENLNVEYNPATLLSSLVSNEEEMFKIVGRLKISNQEREIIHFILSNRETKDTITLGSIKRLIALQPKSEQYLAKNSVIEFLKYIGREEIIQEISEWPIPIFPVSGYDLKSKVQSPRHIKHIIDHLKEIWAESDFTLSEEQIENGVKEALKKVESGEFDKNKKLKKSSKKT